MTVISTSHLLPHVKFDLEAVRSQVSALNPGSVLLVTSSANGEGIGAWCDLLAARLEAKRASCLSVPEGDP